MSNSVELNSQAKLGGRAKIDQRTVGRILNSEHMPTLDKISALAEAYGIEAWQLLAPGLGSSLYKIDADRRIVPVLAAAAANPPTGPSRKRIGRAA